MSTRKKILHLITGLEIGGAEMMLLKTLPYLQDDFDNRVCCLIGHGPIGKRLEEVGVPVYYLELKNTLDFGIIWRFRKVIRDFQPDILVTYLIHADLFGRIFGRLFGIKKVMCSVRVKLVQIKYLPLLFLDGLTSLLVTHYHFNSKTVADMYRRFFFLPERKITVIPNGLEIEKYQILIDTRKKRQDLCLPEDSILIGCVGRLEKQKGQKYLIEAFSELVQQHPSAILLIVGDGAERKFLETLAKKLEVNNVVKFLGKRNDVPEILKLLDIFVLPSLYEGMSNALMEAMASGLPIITTNILENRELIRDSRVGILVPPKDSNSIAQAINSLVNDFGMRNALGDNAKSYIIESFNLPSTISRMRNFYLSL